MRLLVTGEGLGRIARQLPVNEAPPNKLARRLQLIAVLETTNAIWPPWIAAPAHANGFDLYTRNGDDVFGLPSSSTS